MKRFSSLLVVLVVAVSLLSPYVLADEKGAIPDKIYFDVRIQPEIAIQDVIAGKSDILLEGMGGPAISGLSNDALENLDLYQGAGGKLSLFLNPYPNKAPYIGNVEGEDVFNPFAIREVRYAMNWLVDRQYIVDNILDGLGGPMITPIPSVMPGTYKYNLVASKMGMSGEGDENKAIDMITAAMKKASELDELKGRLTKGNEFWTMDGEPVTIKFIARADDPNIRMPIAQYVAQQLNKAGIKAEVLNWERSKALKVASSSNPADLKWNMYTGGWGLGVSKWWDSSVTIFYSSVYGLNPGGNREGYWSYRNEEIDKLSKAVYTGNISGLDQYWDYNLRATELGLKDSVRIWIAYKNEYFLTNDDNLDGRMVYGGNGLSQYSLMSAKPKDGTLRVTQIASTGSLFMDEWDPIGIDGFGSVYSRNISDMLEAPYWPYNYKTASYSTEDGFVKATNFKTKAIKDEEGNRAPGLKVPDTAVMWDPKEDKWTPMPDGTKSYSTTLYEYDMPVWHHGIDMSIHDYMYSRAFIEEWISKDFEGDKYYQEEYSHKWNGRLVDFAYIWDEENEAITTYYNYTHPSEDSVVIAGMPWDTPAGQITMPWEIYDALARMVVDGGESGEVWSFSETVESGEHVDLLSTKCTEDIKAELIQMKEEKYIPMYLEGFVSTEEAIARYEASLKWIEDHNHAIISNGPYYMYEYDMANNFAELRAFRDEGYPYEKGHFRNIWESTQMEIKNVELPTMAEHGKDFEITIDVLDVTFPQDVKSPGTDGIVTALFVAGDKEIKIKAEYVEEGVYKAVIDGEYTQDIEADSYVLVVQAAKTKDAAPDISTHSILIY